MSSQPLSPTAVIRAVYGIALSPAVAERLDVAITRSLTRAASLLTKQPVDFDGFAGKSVDAANP